MDVDVPSCSPPAGVKKNSKGEVRASPQKIPKKSTFSKEIALLQAFVSSSRASKEELEAWNKIKLALETTSASPVSATTSARELSEVKQEIKSLSAIVTKLVQKPVASATPSVSSSVSASRSYSSALQRDLVLPSRRSRELVVSLPAESEEEKKRTGEALVKALQVPSLPSSLEIVAARRLPSTDIAITFSSTSACKQWEDNNPLDQANLRIKSRDYNVIIPRFPRGLSSSAPDLIECLRASNPKLDIQVTKATFLKKGLATQYPRIPLVLSLKEPAHANLVCDKGLVYKGEIYDCELFCGDARPKRCLRCQKYTSHIAKHCRSTERCGYCGGTHSSTSCTAKEDKARAYCVPCNKRGHSAFSTSCQSWRQQLERSRAAYLSRPNRFQIPASTPPSTVTCSSSSFTDEFTVVRPRKRRLQSGQTTLSFNSRATPTPSPPLPFPSSSVPFLIPSQDSSFAPELQGAVPCSQDLPSISTSPSTS